MFGTDSENLAIVGSENYSNDNNKENHLDDIIFEDCKENYEKYAGKNVSYWQGLADKYHYESKDAIRGVWRREAKRRGYNKTSKIDRKSGGPKILIFDIETSPLICYSFSLWPERISIDQIIKDWHIIGYSAKWLFEENVTGEVLTSKEIKNGDDSRLVKALWKLFNEADILVSFNGQNFDIKRCNTRFLINNLLPPSRYISVDPIITAKKVFDFASNKMDWLAQSLDLDKKIHTDFSLWSRCMNGNEDALEEINVYCQKDTLILENLYLEMLPWLQSHPNLALYYADEVERCPHCASENIKKNTGTYKTITNSYAEFTCGDCGYRGHEKKSLISKEKSKTILR